MRIVVACLMLAVCSSAAWSSSPGVQAEAPPAQPDPSAAQAESPPKPQLEIHVDKTSQRMTVLVDGKQQHVWRVSTGRSGYRTPNGKFRPQWLARRWFSRKYDMSPMPYSIFFKGGYAIHGTDYVSSLGSAASHGCVRLSPRHAAALFALVRKYGKEDTQIVVTGSHPERVHVAKRKSAPVSTYTSGIRRSYHYGYGSP